MKPADEKQHSIIQEWEKRIGLRKAEEKRLVCEGKWVRGPMDVLSIIGKERHETYHSAILAWLMDPLAPHRLSHAFLRELMEIVDPGWRPLNEAIHIFEVRTEVTRSNCRADVVVFAKEFTLVIENKIDSDELDKQCDRIYKDFKDDPSPRFIFLTPTGRNPKSASSAALQTFKPVKYLQVRDALSRAVNMSTDKTTLRANESVLNYLETLQKEFPDEERNFPMKKLDDDRIIFYLRHHEDIRSWAAIENELPQLFHKFMRSMKDGVDNLASRLGQDVKVYSQFENKYSNIFLYREKWGLYKQNEEEKEWPRVAIGLEWRKDKINLVTENPYVGLWVEKSDSYGETLQERLKQKCQDVIKRNEKENSKYHSEAYWPCWQYVLPNRDFWDDLMPYREKLLKRVESIWNLFENTVDEVVIAARHELPGVSNA